MSTRGTAGRKIAGKGGRAARPDLHALYEAAVQNAEFEVEFIQRVFRRPAGRPLSILREDFCGTAAITCVFARSRQARRAVGIDLHGPTLDVARTRHVAALPPEASAKVQLVRADALAPPAGVGRSFDAVCALNFSYWVFRERATMLRYLRACRDALTDRGVLVLDFMGGAECHVPTTDRSRRWLRGFGPFTYVWEHKTYDPITAHTTCAIHFEFPPDRRRPRAKRPAPIRDAFVYHWRLWQVAELRDLLAEAGYSRVECHWEGETERGEGDGVFRPRTRGTPDRSYVGYLVAQR